MTAENLCITYILLPFALHFPSAMRNLFLSQPAPSILSVFVSSRWVCFPKVRRLTLILPASCKNVSEGPPRHWRVKATQETRKGGMRKGGRSVGRSIDGSSSSSFFCSDGPRRHCVGRSVGKTVDGRSPSSFSCSDGPRRHWGAVDDMSG